MSESKKLSESACVPCQGGVDPLNADEIGDYRRQVPAWDVVKLDGVDALRRQFKFDSYGGALAFTNTVAELAEREDHHPAIVLEWGSVTVSWWTHKINGLHLNDFIAAVKTDELFDT